MPFKKTNSEKGSVKPEFAKAGNGPGMCAQRGNTIKKGLP